MSAPNPPLLLHPVLPFCLRPFLCFSLQPAQSLDRGTYRKESQGDDDGSILSAADLVDGVAHVSGVGGSRAAKLASFGRHGYRMS